MSTLRPQEVAVATTLNDETYRRIRQMILAGDLAPGSQLVQRTLATLLGTSTMPIVQALNRLERDGFVIAIPKAGIFVKRWTNDEIREAAYIRRALEGEAGRLFLQRASHEDRARLSQLSDQFDACICSDPLRAEEVDLEFHLHLVRATRFPQLYQLVESSKIQNMTIWRRSSQTVDYRKLAGCHGPIVQAIWAGDEEGTLRAIWDHVMTAIEGLADISQGVH